MTLGCHVRSQRIRRSWATLCLGGRMWRTCLAGPRRRRRRRLLAEVTFGFLGERRISKSAFRSLLTNYIHPYVHRRCLLAVFHRSFKFLESLEDEETLVRLPADMADELALAAALL